MIGYYNRYRLVQGTIRPRPELKVSGQDLLNIELHCVAKAFTNKYSVPNELIALVLGRAIGLPVVDGAPLTFEFPAAEEKLFWASFSIGEELPDGEADIAEAEDINTATGVVVFDAWICNGDRHEKNFCFRKATRQFHLFDHGEAICRSVGPQHLENNFDGLGLCECHCIAKELPHLGHVEEWCKRIASLPVDVIVSVVESARGLGLTSHECDQISESLVVRARRLMYLFATTASSSDFPKRTHLFDELPKLVEPTLKREIEVFPQRLVKKDVSDYSI